MRLPDFLIVGAMKSGTTGVFQDLCRHPQVYLPHDKEPHALTSDVVLTDGGRTDYAAFYSDANKDQLLCDASTGYTKRPGIEGVAERAVAVLPDGFRVIYVVRDPIDRIISQHYHELIEGLVGADINQAVREEARFIDFSRYGFQLAPWIEAVGKGRVKVVRFENYSVDRQTTVLQLCEFLELPAGQLQKVDSVVHNRSEEKTVKNRFWRRVQHSSWFRRGLRRQLSPRMRTQFQKWVLPRGPDRPAPPSPETINWLREQLSEEVRQISEYAGSKTMLWDNYAPGKGLK